MANAELTRVSNFIEKEISVSTLDEVYESLLHLDEIKKKVAKGMDTLIAYLQKEGIKPEEYFPEKETKIIYQEGKDKSEIDVQSVFNELPPKQFATVVKIVEKDLKALEDGPVLIAKYKKIIGKAKDGIYIKPMTKTELKEHTK